MRMRLPVVTDLKRQMAIGLFVKACGAVTSFAFTWLVARSFGSEGVGHYATALVTAGLSAVIAMAGLDYVLVREVAVGHSTGNLGPARTVAHKAYRFGLIAASGIAAILILGRDVIADKWFEAPTIAPYLAVMALLIPFTVYTRMSSNILRAVGRMGVSQAIEGPIATAAGCALLLCAIGLQTDVPPIFAAIAYVTGWGVGVIIAAIMVTRIMAHWPPAAPYEGKMLGSGVPITLAFVSDLFTDWFGTVMLAATHGPAAAGVFRVASQVASSLRLLSSTAEAALQAPLAASHARGDLNRIGSLLRQAILALFVASLPILIAILVAPRWIMGLFGQDFVSGAIPLQVLVLGQICVLVLSGTGAVMIMAHQERFMAGVAVTFAALSAVLAIVLIPRYGALGAAITAVVPSVAIRLAALAGVRFVVGVPLLRARR